MKTVFMALVFWASSGVMPGVSAQDVEADAESSGNPLAGTKWRLVEFQSMSDAVGTVQPSDPSLYTMDLDVDGTVTMRLNCNRATSTWTAEVGPSGEGGPSEFGPLAVTRALCPPPRLDEQISSQAGFIRSFLLKDGRLYLSLMADGGIYSWEPRDLAPSPVPGEGGPRAWEVYGVSGRLNLRGGPSISSEVIGGYPPGTILHNLGCRQQEERIWCDVQELDGGPRGFVARDYLRPSVSPDGSVPRGPNDSVLRAGDGEFDATGEIPSAGSPGQPMGSCAFGVARGGGGYATVVIQKAGGGSRAIYSRLGIPVGADGSQADGYPELSATQEADLHLIRVGDERYEIPDAVVLGG